MPVAVPPLEEMLVNVRFSGVVPAVRFMSTAVAVVELMVPLVVVMVLVLSIACSPAMPASGEISREPKVIVPVLPVPAPPKTTAVLPEAFAAVFPKLSAAPDEATLRPLPVGFVIVVVGLVKLPAT